ncbi:MAG: YtxH domain-containing protein [Candidatus Acidiferrales bacterium]|jgi:gas vesicle protein
MRDTRGWAGSISGFMLGLGVGAAVGVLLAPRPGTETRRAIGASAQSSLDGAIATGQRLAQQAQDGIDQAKGQIRQAAKVGERAYREAKNTSS